MNSTSILDIGIILLYLAVVVGIAIKSNGKSGKAEDLSAQRFLAGKTLGVWEVAFSIVATETSALTFLGLSAISFVSDFSFMQFYIGCVVARILHIVFYIPRIYDKGITLYEIVAGNDSLTINGRRGVSGIYLVSKLVLIGVRLFSGSIIISQFFDVGIIGAIIIVALMTASYSLIGGLKTVVRTDFIQLILLVVAGIFSHYLIADLAGVSWVAALAKLFEAGKLSFIGTRGWGPFFLSLFGGFLYAWAIGIDQDYAQRILGARNIKTAQLGVAYGSVIAIFLAALFLGVGSLLWVYYQGQPLPQGIVIDRLFAHFIISYFPSPFRGMVIVGILAATMSTLDSAINALSSCLYNDILPRRDLRRAHRYQLLDTTVIILVIVGVAIFASKCPGMIILGIKLPALTLGGLLGIVVAKIFWPSYFNYKLNIFTVLTVCILSAAGVAISSFFFNSPWYLDYFVGLIISISCLALAKRLFQKAS